MKKNINIIGAGPAGLSAAIQLAHLGVHSTIIDENVEIGGAIFKKPYKGLKNSAFRDEKTFIQAKKLYNEFEQLSSYIHLKLESEVMGNFPLTKDLAILQKGKIETISDQYLLISTGCYERAQPFPGWTLPGIMSVGGIQLQAKCGNVKPGNRAALIGTGPLLMVAAKQLHMAGVEVVAVVEAGKQKQIAKKSLNLMSNLKLLKEGIDYMAYLKKHKIPFYYGHGVVSAKGENGLEEIMIAPYNDKWEPVKEKSFSLEVDCVGIQYGYVPRVQLTQMLKCEHQYDSTRGGFFSTTDNWQRTSVEKIYSAGDSSGVYGSDIAMLSGKIAALGYLIDSNQISLMEAQKIANPMRKRMAKFQKFQHALNDFSGLKEGLMTLSKKDTIICRCEHVKQEAIDKAINLGVKNMSALKIRTRVGMGDCQGKMCGSYCNEYLAHKLNQTNEEVGWLKPRFPLTPIPFDAISPGMSE